MAVAGTPEWGPEAIHWSLAEKSRQRAWLGLAWNNETRHELGAIHVAASIFLLDNFPLNEKKVTTPKI